MQRVLCKLNNCHITSCKPHYTKVKLMIIPVIIQLVHVTVLLFVQLSIVIKIAPYIWQFSSRAYKIKVVGRYHVFLRCAKQNNNNWVFIIYLLFPTGSWSKMRLIYMRYVLISPTPTGVFIIIIIDINWFSINHYKSVILRWMITQLWEETLPHTGHW